MSNRAIRADQLMHDSNRTVHEATSWTTYTHDNELWNNLAEATEHRIEINGVHASTIQTDVANLRNNLQSSGNYFQTMSHVYNSLVPYLIKETISGSPDEAFMREKLIEMRDACVANPKNQDYGYQRSDPNYTTIMQELCRKMWEIAEGINDDYFKGPNQIVNPSVNYEIVDAETTDDMIDEILEGVAHYRSLWRITPHYLIQGGMGRRSVVQYPTIPADVMSRFMEHLIETNLALAISIAHNHQFFLDNPMAKSIGHSWTSRNRSDDCWFKVDASQVTKNSTVVFTSPSDFFGKHTPTLSDMVDKVTEFKQVVLDYLKAAEPAIKVKVDDTEAKEAKSEESYNKAVVKVIQDLLDDSTTEELGTHILTYAFGIATPQIDFSSQPNGQIIFTYHDFIRNQDVNQHLYPQHLVGVLSPSDFTITDAVQTVIYTMYQETLELHRTNHANRCAQLARQISQQTTRHDADVKVITDAFTEYQAQV